jgi:hypothetical protein
MDQLTATLAGPFRQHGKRELSTETFCFTLSLTLGWLSPQQAREVLSMGVHSGLLTLEKGSVHAVFDPKQVDVPAGFQPDFVQLRPPGVAELAAKRVGQAGRDPAMLPDATRNVEQRYADLLDPELAVLVAAAELGADVLDLAREVEARLRRGEPADAGAGASDPRQGGS